MCNLIRSTVPSVHGFVAMPQALRIESKSKNALFNFTERYMMPTRYFKVLADKKLRFVGTNIKAFAYILRSQPHSVDYALMYNGWELIELTDKTFDETLRTLHKEMTEEFKKRYPLEELRAPHEKHKRCMHMLAIRNKRKYSGKIHRPHVSI